MKSGETPSETYRELWDTILAGSEWHGEFHNKKKTGELYWESASISPITDARGAITHFVAVKEDITARKQVEAQLQYLSTHDALTGLYNRAYFETELARIGASRALPVSIIVADVNDLKIANDTRGHPAGDELLRQAALVLRAVFRAADIIARVGGDEFAIILPATDAITAEQSLARVKSKLVNLVTPQFKLPISISLGMATSAGGALDDAFKLADKRMYIDKRAIKCARAHAAGRERVASDDNL